MLKDFIWNFFEKTGSVETFLEYNMMQSNSKGENDDKDDKGSDN